MELQDDIKTDLRLYFETISPMVKKLKPKIRGFIVQYDKGNIYVGSAVRNSFLPVFDSSTDDLQNLELYVGNNSQCLTKIFNIILTLKGMAKSNSYNIFYCFKDKSINISQNILINYNLGKRNLFNEFI
jgi:hypothetical protein